MIKTPILPIERTFHNSARSGNANVVIYAQVDGPYDREVLTRAIASCLESYPRLRSRIDGDSFVTVEGANHIFLEDVAPETDSDEVITDLVNDSSITATHLSKFLVRRLDPSGFELFVVVSHAICDIVSLVGLVHVLLAEMAFFQTGNKPEEAPVSTGRIFDSGPVTMAQRLEFWRHVVEKNTIERFALPPKRTRERKTIYVRRKIEFRVPAASPSQYNANHWLTACFIKAYASRLKSPNLATMVFANIRSFQDGVTSPDFVSCRISMLHAFQTVRSDTPPVDIATDFARQIRHRMKENWHKLVRDSSSSIPILLDRLGMDCSATLNVSFATDLPSETTVGCYRIVDMRTAASLNNVSAPISLTVMTFEGYRYLHVVAKAAYFSKEDLGALVDESLELASHAP